MHVKLYGVCELLKYGVVSVFIRVGLKYLCISTVAGSQLCCTHLRNACLQVVKVTGEVLLSKTVKGQQTVAGDL